MAYRTFLSHRYGAFGDLPQIILLKTDSLQLSSRPSLSVCLLCTSKGNCLFIHIILPVSPQEHPLPKDLQTAELHSFAVPYFWLSIAFQSLQFLCWPDFLIFPWLLLWFSWSMMQFPIVFLQAVHLKNKNYSRSSLKNGRNKYGKGEILMSPISSFLSFWLIKGLVLLGMDAWPPC